MSEIVVKRDGYGETSHLQGARRVDSAPSQQSEVAFRPAVVAASRWDVISKLR